MSAAMINGWDQIAVPGELLLVALVLERYGTVQNQKDENATWLSLSAFVASTALSIVALTYLFMLPLFVILKHTHLFFFQETILVLLFIIAITLTLVGYRKIRREFFQ